MQYRIITLILTNACLSTAVINKTFRANASERTVCIFTLSTFTKSTHNFTFVNICNAKVFSTDFLYSKPNKKLARDRMLLLAWCDHLYAYNSKCTKCLSHVNVCTLVISLNFLIMKSYLGNEEVIVLLSSFLLLRGILHMGVPILDQQLRNRIV